MIARAMFALALALAVAACGVKTDLEPPKGAMNDERQPDPSRPPVPLGR
jgi:hypothetical protein